MKDISVKDNFWTELTQQTNRTDLENYLLTKLGKPTDQTQTNLYQEISKKIGSYYFPLENQTTTIYSLLGTVTKINQKVRTTGKNRGQNKYLLEITEGDKVIILQALAENLTSEKWTQIEKLAILGQKLAFKYKIWITNKQLLDFQPMLKTNSAEPPPAVVKPKGFNLKKNSHKTQTGTDVG